MRNEGSTRDDQENAKKYFNERIAVLEVAERRLARYLDQVRVIDTNLSRFLYDQTLRREIIMSTQYLFMAAKFMDDAWSLIANELTELEILSHEEEGTA